MVQSFKGFKASWFLICVHKLLLGFRVLRFSTLWGLGLMGFGRRDEGLKGLQGLQDSQDLRQASALNNGTL